MKTQTKKSNENSNVRTLFGLGAWVILALLLFVLILKGISYTLSGESPNWKWPWKIKMPAVEVVQESPVNLEDFVKENYMKMSEGEEIVGLVFFSDTGTYRKITLKKLSPCCYYAENVLKWANKYKIPSIVYPLKSGTQLPYSFQEELETEEDTGKVVKINLVEGYSNPEILANSNNNFWLFDKNGNELPKW